MIEIIPNWHPLFVHFTVALFSLSIIFFVIQRPLAETEIGDNFLIFARYSLWLGVFFGIVTVIAGFDAYNTVDHDTPSHTAMTDHKNWGLTTFGLFFVAAIWWKLVDSVNEKASIAFLIFILIAGGLLVTTGHKGSILVYQFGLGVQSLPAKDDHKSGGGHDHDHGASTSDNNGEGHHAAGESIGGHSHDESAAGSHHETEKAKDGHAHEHDTAENHHASSNSMSDKKPPVADDDMGMDNLMIEPDTSHADKEVKEKKVTIKTAEPKLKVVEKVEKVAEIEVVTENEPDDNNTFLISSGGRKPPPTSKIEKYEDGSVREVLPAVKMDVQK